MSFVEKIKSMRGYLRRKIESKTPDLESLGFEIHEPKRLVVLPEEENSKNINLEYPLLEPYTYAHIKWSKMNDELIYRVREPDLREDEKEMYEKITEGLLELVDIELSSLKKPGKAMDYVEGKVKRIIDELNLGMNKTQFNKIMYHIYRNFVGLEKIEPFLHDPYIEDIGCDGIGTPVYVVHKKFGSVKTNIVFEDEDKLKDFVVKLAERCGRYVSYAEPLFDGSLPDGSRVQASLAEDVTTKGPTFSIRKFTKEPYSPTDIIDLGTASPKLLAYIWFCVENGISGLVCGGVATGKTTLLNAISLFIPSQSKIVSIEDTRELNLPHENWIPAVVRLGFGMPTASGKKYGEVDMFELLKESFRQNPDYVIVGEVRGEEAYVMFQGMASGHPCLGTMHAGGVETVIRRLESPPIELSPALVETLDVVITMVHAKEKGESERRVQKVTEIVNVESGTGEAETNSVFSWHPSEDEFKRGPGNQTLREIAETKGITMQTIEEEIEKRIKVLRWMKNNNKKDWREVSKVIDEYKTDPESVLERVEEDIEGDS
ncbi:MAG: type II/IV secretion system ATPase subunit [Candidatus Aenigmatarchaeota archaeon]